MSALAVGLYLHCQLDSIVTVEARGLTGTVRGTQLDPQRHRHPQLSYCFLRRYFIIIIIIIIIIMLFVFVVIVIISITIIIVVVVVAINIIVVSTIALT